VISSITIQTFHYLIVYLDGTTMVCSSNLNGRLWKGSLVIYGNPDLAAEGDAGKAVAGTVTSAGIADGTFLSSPGDVCIS